MRSRGFARREIVYVVLMALIVASMWIFLPDYNNYGL